MKLLVLSDLHLEFADFELPADVRFDVALLAGDIVSPGSKVADWVRRDGAMQQARAVLHVSGNHEFYDTTLQDELSRLREPLVALAGPALHFLHCDSRVVDGVRFLGCTLWTDFSLRIDTLEGPRSDVPRGMKAAGAAMADYRAIDFRDPAAPVTSACWRKLTAEDTLTFHHHQRAWLEAALAQPFDGPTVVITHHGPHRNSLAPRFADDWVSTAFISELPAHFFERPVLWVHGHTHTSFDYRVGNCRVLCNPRGYQGAGRWRPENRAFDPALVVQV
ncbi:MAG: metallophosphoesterase [Rubrivivax sp.]